MRYVLTMLFLFAAWNLPLAREVHDADENTAVRNRILVNLKEPRAGALDLSGLPGLYSKRRGYVQSRSVRQKVREIGKAYGLLRVDGWPMESLGLYCTVFEVPEQWRVEDIVERLSSDREVESVQKLNVFRTQSRQYNDQYYDLQYGFSTIDAAGAHKWVTGNGIRIGVIDTGIESDHPDLRGRVAASHMFIPSRLRNGSGNRHGTAVAGVIASNADNAIGIAGVAPNADLVAMKACWQVDQDTGLCDSYTLARALDFAIGADIDIINMSLAGPADPLLERLVKLALQHQIVVVAAVDPSARASFPAMIDGVIAVDAHEDPQLGRRLENEPIVQFDMLYAPGVDIVSPAPPSEYDFFSGSSIAAAHVTGIVALLLEQSRELSMQSIALTLRRSSY